MLKRVARKPACVKLIAAIVVILALTAVAPAVASAACDTKMGSSFSNSNPLINITANNGGHFPVHIMVGQYSWGSSGGVANLGGGYYKQKYVFAPGFYTVGSTPRVDLTYPSTAGSCASVNFRRNITVIS